MKRDCTYPYGQLTRFLMALFLVLCISFLIGCNASITFPTIPIWKPTPKKNQLLEDLNNQLQKIQGASVCLDGEDITILFSEDSVSEKQIRTTVNEVLASFDRVASSWAIAINNNSSKIDNIIVETLKSFDALQEEIKYKATITYKKHPFILNGEFVFYDIYAKTRTPTEIAYAFRQTHKAVLELKTSEVKASNYLSIFGTIAAFNKLPTTAQIILDLENTHLTALRERIKDNLGVDGVNLLDYLGTMNEAPLEIRVPYTAVNGELEYSIPLTGNDFGLNEDDYTVIFKDFKSNAQVNSLSFPKGASTQVVKMEVAATVSGESLFVIQVVYKIPSVSLGNDQTTLYTIEEALMVSNGGEFFINADTSFASAEVATVVYGGTEHLLKSHTTLVLPYDDNRIVNFNGNPADNAQSGPIDQNSEGHVRLHLPEDISLKIKGKLLVGALRGAQSTKYQGHVTQDLYSVLNLATGSKITMEYRGQLYALGFVEGEGKITVLNGGTVFEGMFISSFRGGTSTSNIYHEVFPFDQYTMMQIESPLVIHPGGHYVANAQVWVSQKYRNGDFPLVGPNALIALKNGILQKDYNPSSGLVTLQFTEGSKASLNHTSVNIGSLSADTEGKAIPFDGTWKFVVEDGSTLDINTKIALLPGSELLIKNGGTVNVTKGGELTVFNPYTYQDNYYNSYPNNATAQYHRQEPDFADRFKNSAKLINEGLLKVVGGITGKVQGNGSFNTSSAKKKYDLAYVHYTEVKGVMVAETRMMEVVYNGP